MKSRTLAWAIFIIMLAALAFPIQVSAQHPRYKIIELRTLGGPNSFQTAPGQTVNNRGEVIAFADTPVPDPFAPNCLQSDCLVNHAIKWHKGVRTDLGSLLGVNGSVPAWITANGLIAGASENGEIDPLTGLPVVRAVLWNENDAITDLGTLGGNFSAAVGANSRGQVVGCASNTIPDPFAVVMLFPSTTQARAFLWDGSMHDLGALGSGNDASAGGVNERGQVAGFSFTDASPNATTGIPTVHPFLWENGHMIDLGSLGGTIANPGSILFSQGPAPAINNHGQVAGTSTLEGDQGWHPFLWERGVGIQDLGTLGGANGEAFWLSDSGLVVGRADFSPESTNHHAFLWNNGVMTDLGVLPPCLNSTAYGVNSAGQVVGDTGACPGGGHPFLSEHGEPMVDLTTLVLPGSDLTLIAAAFINERGEIAGMGVLPNGDFRAVLLVPASAEEIEAAKALAQTSEPRVTQVPASAIEDREELGAPLSRMLDAWRARLAQHYHIPGLNAPKE